MDPLLAADLLAGFHLGIVIFMIGGQVLVLLGWILGWDWARNAWFRLTHLGIMIYIAQNAARGKFCFLTHWEHDLRAEAGQRPEDISFVGKILRDLLYVDSVSAQFLNGCYLAFFVLVLVTVVGYRPRFRKPAALPN